MEKLNCKALIPVSVKLLSQTGRIVRKGENKLFLFKWPIKS
jgi:hypothetical protein